MVSLGMKELNMKIDRGYAIISTKKLEYPFRDMKVGDSFLCPPGVPRARAVGASKYWTKKLGYRFSIKTTNDGFRVWRVS